MMRLSESRARSTLVACYQQDARNSFELCRARASSHEIHRVQRYGKTTAPTIPCLRHMHTIYEVFNKYRADRICCQSYFIYNTTLVSG